MKYVGKNNLKEMMIYSKISYLWGLSSLKLLRQILILSLRDIFNVAVMNDFMP